MIPARYALSIGAALAVTAIALVLIVFIVATRPDTHANLGKPDPGFNRVPTGEIAEEQPFRPSFDAEAALITAERDGPIAPEERGRILFFANSCATCHGIAAAGATVGPDLIDAVNLEDFLDALREGDEGMPAFAESEITDAEAEAIFAFLESMETGATASRSSELRR